MPRTEILTEDQFQNWRVVAAGQDGKEHLLVLGANATQVAENYATSYHGYLTDAERTQVNKIELQRWSGTASRGLWAKKKTLPIPEKRPFGGAD